MKTINVPVPMYLPALDSKNLNMIAADSTWQAERGDIIRFALNDETVYHREVVAVSEPSEIPLNEETTLMAVHLVLAPLDFPLMYQVEAIIKPKVDGEGQEITQTVWIAFRTPPVPGQEIESNQAILRVNRVFTSLPVQALPAAAVFFQEVF